MSKIGIGLVGFGAIAQKHLATMRASAEVDVAGVFDPLPAARAAAAREGLRCFAAMDELFAAPGLRGVIVATPNQLHAEGAIACIERGIPALVEKPVADTLAVGTRILAAQRAGGTPVLVGHHRRHNPIVQTARDRAFGPDRADHRGGRPHAVPEAARLFRGGVAARARRRAGAHQPHPRYRQSPLHLRRDRHGRGDDEQRAPRACGRRHGGYHRALRERRAGHDARLRYRRRALELGTHRRREHVLPAAKGEFRRSSPSRTRCARWKSRR